MIDISNISSSNSNSMPVHNVESIRTEVAAATPPLRSTTNTTEAAGRWRSPVMDATAGCSCSSSSSLCSTATVDSDSVEIPIEGWYAFCFGCSSSTCSVWDKNNIHEANYEVVGVDVDVVAATAKNEVLSARMDRRPVDAVLCVTTGTTNPTTDKAKTSASTIGLDLPLASGNGWLENVNVGKQIFLTKGAKLTVTVTHQHDQNHKNQPEEIVYQWCVVFHHPLQQERHTGSLAATPPQERPLLGTLSHHKKSLVCRHCVRSFPSQHAVINHMVTMHSEINSNNKTNLRTTKRRRSSNDDDDSEVDSLYDQDMWTRPLSVLFQDDFMAVIDKPQGMAVMGTKPSLMRSDLLMALLRNNNSNTNNNISSHNNNLEGDDTELRKPRPVHRLDAATGGVLVVAKTRRAEAALKTSLAQRQCHKRYRAIVVGKLEVVSSNLVSSSMSCTSTNNSISPADDDRGVVDVPISGKPSLSRYRPVRHVPSVQHHHHHGWLTLVDLWPVTGRRHQLRKHMKELGHPILGDRRYGGVATSTNTSTNTTTATKMCLWAVEITLPHPHTGDACTVGLPRDPAWLEHVLQVEGDAWKRTQTAIKNQALSLEANGAGAVILGPTIHATEPED